MRLKSIDVYGFKSFADRTRINFDQQITGIVGPNGCGKSNVVDAIRWVLGEQKIRNLRSEKMENVIFNGTDLRKRANITDVTITFENDRGILPVEYTSVAITRRLYRDGESEYLLNAVPCRLKDIQNLLLDTGIGSDSYAIIELRMIEEMITDRQGSRRQLFEEAAGISRYKVRKRETLQRLNDTDQSLERVEDLVFEVERQAKRYEKQAKKAVQFRKLRESYRKAGVCYAWLQLQNAKESQQHFNSEENRIRDNRSALEAKIAQLESQIADLQPRQSQFETQLAQEQKELQARMEDIAQQEQEKSLRQQRSEFLKQRLAEMKAVAERDGIEKQRSSERMAELETAIDVENEQSDRLDYLIGERETEIENLREAVRNRKLQVDELTSSTRSKEQALNRLRKEVDVRTTRANSLQEESQRLGTELAQQDEIVEKSGKESTFIKDKIESLTQEQETQSKFRAELLQKIEAGEQEKLRLSEERSEQLRQRALTQQELELIRNLIDNLDGYPESVAWLKRNAAGFADVPLVSDLFYCDAPYRAALEHFLEGYVNSYVVPTRGEALEAIAQLDAAQQGRAHFFVLADLATTAAPVPLPEWPGFRPLIEKVEYEAQYGSLAQHLLGSAWISETDALPTSNWPTDRVWLQPSGRFVARGVSCSGGSVGRFEGKRLGRQQHVEKLAEEVAQLDKDIHELEKQAQQQAAALVQFKNQLPDKELARIQQQLGEVQREDSRLQARMQEIEKGSARTRLRADEARQQLAQLTAEIAHFGPQADALQDEVDQLAAQLNQQQRAWNDRNEAFSKATTALNQEQIEAVQVQNRIDSLKQDFRNQFQRVNEIEERATRYDKEKTEIESDLQKITEVHNDNDQELLRRYRDKDEQERRVASVREQLAAGREEERRREEEVRTLRKNREELLGQWESIRNQRSQIDLELTSLSERLNVEWNIDIHAVKPEEWFESVPNEGTDPQPWRVELEQLRKKVQEFGEVNSTAEEAYQEAADRLTFLTEQREDLRQAKANLMATIAEIDETARVQFMDAFNTIRENFIRVFRTLFTDQDSCDMVLQNPDEPLESAIDIMARPKGKRPLTLQQLSGGEKTLTAISLLFAIYLFKPAPFCIFDEVDAPLDDANIDKFSQIITEFSADSQFVVITHNKRTMLRTQALYGVTMEETGVSRVLAVDWAELNLN